MTNCYFKESDCRVDEFRSLIDDELLSSSVPHSVEIKHNVPIYDMSVLGDALEDGEKRRALMAEWSDVLLNRSGVVVENLFGYRGHR